MWIPKALTDNENVGKSFISNVMYSQNGKVSVSGLEMKENIQICMPYGVASVPPVNSEAVVMPVGSSAVVCGVVGDNMITLNSGEVGLYSKGGASIVLKNDGTVVINGQVFEKES